jgi:hypothetical protein
MHQTGQGALEQLPLPEHLAGLAGHPAADVSAAIDGTSHADESRQQSGSSGEQAGRDGQRDDQEDRSNDHRPESTPDLFAGRE